METFVSVSVNHVGSVYTTDNSTVQLTVMAVLNFSFIFSLLCNSFVSHVSKTSITTRCIWDMTTNMAHYFPSLRPPLSPFSHPHHCCSPILPEAFRFSPWLAVVSAAASSANTLIAPLQLQHPLRYTWLWRLIPPFSPLFIPDWEGRRKNQ